MTRDEALNKIKKLLNMTTDRGASEGEMHAAIVNAQNLMDKFGIKQEEFKLSNEEVHEEKFSFGTKSVSSMQAMISMRLSKHFGVEILLTTNTQTGAQAIKVIGEEAKVVIFTETLKYAYNCYQQLWKHYHKTFDPMMRKSTARGDYFEGFIRGVESALTINETKNALVVCSSQLVKNYMQNKYKSTGSRSVRLNVSNNQTHRMAGFRDGKSSMEDKGKVLA